MQKKRISVLLPVRNAEKYIRTSVASILKQTYSNFELVVIDDGCTDKTIPIIESFNDARIRLIHNKKTLGIRDSLNKGIMLCESEYIARMDGDDVSASNRFERQMEIFENNHDVGIVSSWTNLINEDSKQIGFANWSFNSEALYFIFFFRDCIPHPSVMYKRELILNVGLYPNETAEDYALWVKLMRNTKFVHLDEYLLNYRIHKSNLTRKKEELIKISAENIASKTIETLGFSADEALIAVKSFNLESRVKLTLSQKRRAALIIPKVFEKVVSSTPQFLEKKKVLMYAAVEYWKLKCFFSNDDINFASEYFERENFSWVERILGTMYYESQVKHAHLLDIIPYKLSKSHF